MAEPSTGGAKWFSCAEKSPEVADRARLQGTTQVGGRDDQGCPEPAAEDEMEGCTHQGMPAWLGEQCSFHFTPALLQES